MAVVKVRLGEYDAMSTDGTDGARLYRHVHLVDPWGFTHDVLVDMLHEPRQQVIDFLGTLTAPTEHTV
jgi:hypothetical protein